METLSFSNRQQGTRRRSPFDTTVAEALASPQVTPRTAKSAPCSGGLVPFQPTVKQIVEASQTLSVGNRTQDPRCKLSDHPVRIVASVAVLGHLRMKSGRAYCGRLSGWSVVR